MSKNIYDLPAIPPAASVTNAMLANMAQSTIKGRKAGAGTGAPQDMTPGETRSVISDSTSTATAAGTTTLTASSTLIQNFTGSTTQNCDLPVVSTLTLGLSFKINNFSSGVVTVRSSGGNTLQALAANTQLVVTCILTSGTGTASWNWVYLPVQAGITGTGSSVMSASPTLTGTPNIAAATGTSMTLTGAGAGIAANGANHTTITSSYRAITAKNNAGSSADESCAITISNSNTYGSDRYWDISIGSGTTGNGLGLNDGQYYMYNGGLRLVLTKAGALRLVNYGAGVMQTDGSGNVTSSGSLPIAATQAEQETATSTTTFVSPGRQQFHPSAAKAWVRFTSVTTTAIEASYNVTSLTDDALGTTTINFIVSFSTTAYCSVLGVGEGGNTGIDASVRGPTAAVSASSFQMKTLNATQTIQQDMAYISAAFYGDQA